MEWGRRIASAGDYVEDMGVGRAVIEIEKGVNGELTGQ